jgi:hypothetical protein
MWSTLINLALFAAVNTVSVSAQGDLSAANNVTDLEGTWSSNVAVTTGNVSIDACSHSAISATCGLRRGGDIGDGEGKE